MAVRTPHRLPSIWLPLALLALALPPAFARAQTAGERGGKLPVTLTPATAAALDSMVRAQATPYALFRLLDRQKVIAAVLGLLPEGARRPDALLFFDGAENYNRWCLLDRDGQPIDYMVEARGLAVVWLDDGPDDRYQVRARIQREKSAFLQDWGTLAGIASSLVSPVPGTRALEPEPTRFTLTAEYLETPVPSSLALTIRQLARVANADSLFAYGDFEDIVSMDRGDVYFYTRTEVALRNVDRQSFGLGIGASMVAVNGRVIEPDPADGNLVVIKRSATDEWRGRAMALAFVQPGRDALWSPPWQFWRGEFYRDLPRRLSLQLGLELSDRPFDRLFAGVGFGVTGGLDLVGGLALTRSNTPDGQRTVSVAAVRSLDDLDALFPDRYESKLFLGLTARASALRKVFGG